MHPLTQFLYRIIIIAAIFIVAQEVETDAQALPLVLILCPTIIDALLLIMSGKGIAHYLKSEKR